MSSFDDFMNLNPEKELGKGVFDCIIDPDIAQHILGKNTQNRCLNPKLVNQYARDMLNGSWVFVGDPIRIASDGTLLDGQHRLTAVCESGTSQRFVVIKGLRRDDQDVMDRGRKRTVGDILKIHGESNHNILAASLRYVWAMEQNLGFGNEISNNPPTTPQILSVLDRHPGIRESVQPAITVHRYVKIEPSVLTFRHYQFGMIDQDDRDDFYRRLREQDFNGSQDPVSQLYCRIMEDAANKQKRFHQITRHALLVKAWNYYRRGTNVKFLRWSQGGSRPEQFPEAE